MRGCGKVLRRLKSPAGSALAVVDLSRLRRGGHEPPPRPLRRVYRHRPCSGARDQGPARRRHRSPKAGTHGVGQGESRRGLRPGAVPAGDPAEARTVKLPRSSRRRCRKASASDSGAGSGHRMFRPGRRSAELAGIKIEASSHLPGTLTKEVVSRCHLTTHLPPARPCSITSE